MKLFAHHKVFPQAILIGLCVLVFLQGITAYVLSIYVSNLQSKDRLTVYERQYFFINDLKTSILKNIDLLRGYRIFIRQNPDMDYQDSINYLDLLVEEDLFLIRNISVLKDTRIIWVYPPTGNQDALGVDIARIPSQRKDVMFVKETGESVFTGPVDLVQGGTGFIIRIALNIQNEYWGQISIVLNADKYFELIDLFADDYNFNYVMYKTVSREYNIISGDTQVFHQKPVITQLDILNSGLNIGIIPRGGWPDYTVRHVWVFSILLVLNLLISFLVYLLLATRHELKNLVVHDTLTGLYNRTFFKEFRDIIIPKSLRTGTKIGIIVLDVDKFKEINDTYGHRAGDEVLLAFAQLLNANLRGNETAFRVGGDEFFICLPEIIDENEIKGLINRIYKQLHFTMRFQQTDIEVNISTGYAMFPDDSSNIDEVIDIADHRMYLEKDS